MDYRKVTKSSYPITLVEPITKFEFMAGAMVEHVTVVDEKETVTIVLHNIIVPPRDLIAATRDYRGMILIPQGDNFTGAYVVTENMRKIGEGWADKLRTWHVFGYLNLKFMENPLDISETIELNNVKLLEEGYE